MNDIREQAWKYFEMHAGQRMSIFNFYITISTAILAAIGVILGLDKADPWLIVSLGFLLVVFSVVFWGLDMRTKDLIHNAEDVMLKLEEGDEKEYAQIFKVDRDVNDKKKCRFKSYSILFAVVYIVFILIGTALIIVSLTNNLPSLRGTL